MNISEEMAAMGITTAAQAMVAMSTIVEMTATGMIMATQGGRTDSPDVPRIAAGTMQSRSRLLPWTACAQLAVAVATVFPRNARRRVVCRTRW
jgi:hypothetical protein